MSTSATRYEGARTGRPGGGILAALRLEKALSAKELLLAWGALAALGILVFLPHILHGGFYLDDWSNGADTLYNPRGASFGDVINSFGRTTLFRPLLVLYVPTVYWIFGMHMWMHLAWAVFIGIAVSGLLYAVLRTLGLPWIHALAIAGLVLIYPWFDSSRLWPTGDQIALATALALGGLWAALTGLTRDSWKWHAGAAALYLSSILLYEIALPSIAAFGLIYVWRVGWARAKWRWAADIVVVIVGGLWVLTHTARTTSGISGDLEHLRMIFNGGKEIVVYSVLPVGPQRVSLALILIGLVLALGLLSLRHRPNVRAADGGLSLGGWLVTAAGGLAVAVLGWVIFIPADPYYTPAIWGMTNRVNGIAGIGAIILVYATFGVLGSLFSRVLGRRGTLVGLGVTLALGAALGVGYLVVIHRHIGIWNSAYQGERTAIERIKAKYPTLPDGTTLFTTDYPANQTWGVPIIDATWDLDGMVKTEYKNSSLRAFPLMPSTAFLCNPHSLEIRAVDESGAPTGEYVSGASDYSKIRILNLATGEAFRPKNQASCEAVTAGLAPGEEVLMHTY